MFSQDEFIEYNAWPPSKYERLETANSSTKVVGDGTIAINIPNSDGSFRVVTIPGVRHVPDLKVNLLLLGCFLHDGMSVSGSEDRMDLRRNGKTHLTFYPTKPGSTIFGINSEALPLDVALATSTPKEVVTSQRPQLAATYATQLRSTNKPPHLGAIRSVLRFAVETDRTHSQRRRPDVFVSKGKVSLHSRFDQSRLPINLVCFPHLDLSPVPPHDPGITGTTNRYLHLPHLASRITGLVSAHLY
jgi:hypothetical protein